MKKIVRKVIKRSQGSAKTPKSAKASGKSPVKATSTKKSPIKSTVKSPRRNITTPPNRAGGRPAHADLRPATPSRARAPQGPARPATQVVEVALNQMPMTATPVPPTATHHRAPVRKVIRDGKVVPFERRDESTLVILRTELDEAWRRLTAAAALSTLATRSLAEFWDAGADAGIPTTLNRPCGELGSLDLTTVEASTRGSEATLRHLIEACHRAASASIEAPAEVAQRKALRAAVTLDPAWRANQAHYPAQTRAFLGLVEWQCKLAAAWPFAFARFMATIPQRLSSDQFVALAVAVDGTLGDIAHAVGRDEATTIALIEAGRARLAEIFEADCPEIHRQWNIVLRGSGVATDALIQRYVVDSLNREWQMLLGAMIIGALRGAERADTVSAVHHHTP